MRKRWQREPYDRLGREVAILTSCTVSIEYRARLVHSLEKWNFLIEKHSKKLGIARVPEYPIHMQAVVIVSLNVVMSVNLLMLRRVP